MSSFHSRDDTAGIISNSQKLFGKGTASNIQWDLFDNQLIINYNQFIVGCMSFLAWFARLIAIKHHKQFVHNQLFGD